MCVPVKKALTRDYLVVNAFMSIGGPCCPSASRDMRSKKKSNFVNSATDRRGREELVKGKGDIGRRKTFEMRWEK